MFPTFNDTLITGTVCVVPGAIGWASAGAVDSIAAVKRANVNGSDRLMVDLLASGPLDAETGGSILGGPLTGCERIPGSRFKNDAA
jgi:hypothetical protein